MKPNVLVMSGYGINCEEETSYAFEKVGAKSEIIHINDLIDGSKKLDDYQILAFPGGFSYGDDTGSGKAFANRIRNNLWQEVKSFVEKDRLVIGICNGFQIMTSLGLLPALNKKYGKVEAALVHNDSARYYDRWVDLQFEGNSPWVQGISISIPVAHGEGKFYAKPETLAELNKKKLIAARYIKGKICSYQNLEANPNGALEDIAGITDETGRLIGMMPHPERAIDFTHLPNWTLIKEYYKRKGEKLPKEGLGLKIFQNAINYFK